MSKLYNCRSSSRDSTTENGNENETYVKFYIKEEIPVRESFLSCSAVTLLAELGGSGYVGLIIGVSLMDIVSLIDKIFAKFIQKFQK